MKELKVGDRVAIYTSDGRNLGLICGISPQPDLYKVRMLYKETWEVVVHRKQVRLITKKKRREFWLMGHTIYEEKPPGDGYIHVREVVKK